MRAPRFAPPAGAWTTGTSNATLERLAALPEGARSHSGAAHSPQRPHARRQTREALDTAVCCTAPSRRVLLKASCADWPLNSSSRRDPAQLGADLGIAGKL